MKRWIIGGCGVLIGLATARAVAQDIDWRPAGSTPAFQRIQPATPSITLSRPVPLDGAEESNLVPATLLERSSPIFRAKTTEPGDLHLLMPVGPGADTSKQPGVAKPMTSNPEPIQKMPCAADSFAAPPPPQIIYSNRPGLVGRSRTPVGIGYVDADAVEEGGILEDCPPCDTICCVTEACGPCWGERLRNWMGGCDDMCCPPRPCRWVRAEYLLWGISDQHLPPLLTTEIAPIRAPDAAGVLPVSPILFGEDDASDSFRNGARLQLGWWFPRRGRWGMDVSAFMMGPRTMHFDMSSSASGSPVLARPFRDANTGAEAAQLVAYPGLLAGSFSYDSTTRLWGVDAHFRRKLTCGERFWLDGFFGYRHLNLADTIDINERLQVIDPTAGNASFIVNDHFGTRNMFNGVQVGLESELKLLRRWFLAGNLKFAVGNVHQTVHIDGSTTFPGVGVGRGGLFALASNIGKTERDDFAVVTEFGLKFGLDVTEHLRVYAGYNILYLSNAVRAGDQIDRVVNFNQAPDPGNLNPGVLAPARPCVLFRQTDFWAQGGQFGLEYHW